MIWWADLMTHYCLKNGDLSLVPFPYTQPRAPTISCAPSLVSSDSSHGILLPVSPVSCNFW